MAIRIATSQDRAARAARAPAAEARTLTATAPDEAGVAARKPTAVWVESAALVIAESARTGSPVLWESEVMAVEWVAGEVASPGEAAAVPGAVTTAAAVVDPAERKQAMKAVAAAVAVARRMLNRVLTAFECTGAGKTLWATAS